MDEINSQFLKDFEDIEFLDKGGFGNVYKARKCLDGQLYAVKKIRLPGGEENKKMMREVAAISGFDHKNIVRYFHSWIETGNLPDSESTTPWTTNSESLDSSPNPEQSKYSTGSSVIFQESSIYKTSNGKEIKSSEIEQAISVEYLYIQQELCQRGTLKNWLYPDTEKIERDMNVVRSLFSQIVEAVDYVHSKKIIHRDLKPGNIFLADSSESLGSGYPRVKLGDFGLISNAYANLDLEKQSSLKEHDNLKSISLKALKTTDISKLTAHVGTLLYMSPELLIGDHHYDFKIDIYSLGLILFELLVPFSTDSERVEKFTNIRDNTEFPGNFKENFPYEHRLILSMISSDPNERPDISTVYNSVNRNYRSEQTSSTIARKYSTDNENGSEWLEMLRSKPFILESGEAILQNKEVRLKHILPNDKDRANYILSCINSIARDELLVKGKPVIFESCKIPESNSQGIHYYIPRQLYYGREVSPRILREELPTNIFIVTNIKLDKLLTMVKDHAAVQKISSIESILIESGRIFLLENSDHTDINLFYGKGDSSVSIHLLSFIYNTFSWLWTCGSISIIKKYLSTKTFLLVGESELVVKAVNRKQKESVFIVGESGMGKSSLLTSLANKINSISGNNLIMFHKMNDFIANLTKHCSTGICTQREVMSTLNELYDNFEEHLLKYWMTQNLYKVTVHLMLDGLDKLGLDQRNLVFKALNIIMHDFPGVQLWVTLSEEIQDEVEEYFTTLCYRLKGFSQNEQVAYLQNTWAKKIKIESKSMERLKKLAIDCVRTTDKVNDKYANFASNPWYCHMLSEIYENKIAVMLSNEKVKYFKHIEVSRLFQETTNKMLERYLKAKGVQIFDEDFLHIFRENMELRHIYFAIKFLFPDSNCSFLPVFNVTSETIDQMKSTIKDQGILATLDPILFKRKTYAEYFIALFIHKALTNKIPVIDASHLVTFQIFFCWDVLEVVRDQSFHNPDTLKKKVCSKFRHPNVCNFLNEMLQISSTSHGLLDYILPGIYDFATDLKRFNSSKSVILASMQHNYTNLAQYILKSRSQPDIDWFLEKAKDDHVFFIEISLRFANVSFVRYICGVIENWHKNRGKVFRIPEYLFRVALYKGKYEMVKFLVEEKGFGRDTWHKIRENDKKKFGVIHHIISGARGNNMSVIEEKQKLIAYLVNLDRNVLLVRDLQNQTPLLFPHHLNSYEAYNLKIFLATQFGVGSDEISAFGNDLLHWNCSLEIKHSVSPKEYHNNLETLADIGFNQLNCLWMCGRTVIHCAIERYHDFLETITLKLFKKLGADFNILDSDGNTVLHSCIQKNCQLEFVKLLIKYGSDISIKNAKGHCARTLAIQMGNFPLVKMLDEICQPDLNLKRE